MPMNASRATRLCIYMYGSKAYKSVVGTVFYFIFFLHLITTMTGKVTTNDKSVYLNEERFADSRVLQKSIYTFAAMRAFSFIWISSKIQLRAMMRYFVIYFRKNRERTRSSISSAQIVHREIL